MKVHKKIATFVFVSLALTGCKEKQGGEDEKNSVADSNKRASAVFQQAKDSLVHIPGGLFQMGESIAVDSWEIRRLIGKMHPVRLDSFYMSKFKVTNEDFQVFLRTKNIQLDYKLSAIRQKLFNAASSYPELPAHMYWQEAHDYCSWLAEGTGLAFSLPTEAQWEYVAREGGLGTSELLDNWYSKSRTFFIPSAKDRWDYAEKTGSGLGYDQTLPGDFYPANSLGVYGMVASGFEWLSDWYDPDYYDYSPKDNPQGPAEPRIQELHDQYGDRVGERVFNVKSARGGIYFPITPMSMITVRRGFPLEFPAELLSFSVRCVVNQSELK